MVDNALDTRMITIRNHVGNTMVCPGLNGTYKLVQKYQTVINVNAPAFLKGRVLNGIASKHSLVLFLCHNKDDRNKLNSFKFILILEIRDKVTCGFNYRDHDSTGYLQNAQGCYTASANWKPSILRYISTILSLLTWQTASADQQHERKPQFSSELCLCVYQFICGQFPCKNLVKISLVFSSSSRPPGGRS